MLVGPGPSGPLQRVTPPVFCEVCELWNFIHPSVTFSFTGAHTVSSNSSIEIPQFFISVKYTSLKYI